METKSKGGGSGWALCAKYDRDREGPRYLAPGFARSLDGARSMTSIADFAGAGPKRWASIDCRKIIQESAPGAGDGASFMMHVGTNAESPAEYGHVQFTNILRDVQVDATNLFDVVHDDTGVCHAREQGAITTFTRDWDVYTANRGGKGSETDRGRCLIGNGHHFCSYNRKGARFSNAGNSWTNNKPCAGSHADSIYWAFGTDEHQCGTHSDTTDPIKMLGTGCSKVSAKVGDGSHLPAFRYNLLFVR